MTESKEGSYRGWRGQQKISKSLIFCASKLEKWGFGQKSLKNHKRIHNGDKTYSSNYCEKSLLNH